MRWTRYLIVCGILLASASGQAAETAQVHMYCWSPRFQQVKDQTGFFLLDLTTLSSGVNGELAFGDFFGARRSHSSYLILTDTLFGDPYEGVMALDVPDGGDANGNGFSDFFEVSQPVNATSSGAYSVNLFGSGPVSASWSRDGGSSFGTCVLTLQNSPIGTMVFTPTFEVIEYTGPLSYTPGSNTVSGTVNLTQTSNTNNQMQGPVQFTKASTDRFNLLALQSGAWTNHAMQTLTFTNDLYSRDLPWPTNYYGWFDFDDWDPNTFEPDYITWVLSIDDTNDFNHNGIPDFSDDLPPRRPLLSLTVTSSNLLFTIRGDVGHPHQVQESMVLPATNWQTVASVTLTNDPQVVSVTLPATRLKFWRVQAQ